MTERYRLTDPMDKAFFEHAEGMMAGSVTLPSGHVLPPVPGKMWQYNNGEFVLIDAVPTGDEDSALRKL